MILVPSAGGTEVPMRKALPLVVVATLTATVAIAALPAHLLAPGDGFVSAGSLDVEASMPLSSSSGAVATVTVDVEDCGTFTYTSDATGTLTRSAPDTLWDFGADLSSCQTDGGVVRTHHCDGWGHTFETCEADGDGGGDRAVTVRFSLATRTGRDLCRTDLDGDGTTECDLVEGTLEASSDVTEVYVPAKYWTEGTDGSWTCLSRSSARISAPIVGDQGGSSCADLGL